PLAQAVDHRGVEGQDTRVHRAYSRLPHANRAVRPNNVAAALRSRPAGTSIFVTLDTIRSRSRVRGGLKIVSLSIVSRGRQEPVMLETHEDEFPCPQDNRLIPLFRRDRIPSQW